MAVREYGFYGWKLLLTLSFIVATNLAFPLYGGGLIATYMAADLHFDRGTLLIRQNNSDNLIPPIPAKDAGMDGAHEQYLVAGSIVAAAGSQTD